ncbi:hypothetical protein CQW23_23774 [Capsicum baccatum]|uniref:ATPase AAA-type core domain-containing protein n=1 Tax=Capsicum baccatum TaxID=33114 RepID=A0A2G2VSW7_CAPBA|nr:hypothetical protein CQW23_23774 [Capsicum baccatum]
MRDNNEVVYSEDKNEAHDKDDGIRIMLEEVAEGSFVNYLEEIGNNAIYLDGALKDTWHVLLATRMHLHKRYNIQQRGELRKSQNCGIAVRGLHEKVEIDFYGIITDILELEHINDVPEKENSEVENDELLVTNAEVYKDTSFESKSIVNDIVDMLSQLYRDDVESITIGANVIELEAQTEYKVEVDYDEEDSDQEDDTMVEYISDHEENEGTLYLSSKLSASPIPSSLRTEQTKSTTKKVIDRGVIQAPKDFGLEKKKVNSIRASTDLRIDRSTDKWKEGVLLYAPPGRGETLLARAIASNADANFLKVVSSTIIDKYICESARLIREMFNYARDHQIQLVDAILAREPMQTVKSKECTWSCLVIWMEILKIHAAGIDKHGEIDYEAAIKLDEGFNGADMEIFCTICGLHPSIIFLDTC